MAFDNTVPLAHRLPFWLLIIFYSILVFSFAVFYLFDTLSTDLYNYWQLSQYNRRRNGVTVAELRDGWQSVMV
ncbi:hypothetical protein P280DRAFT_548449 [Massarina eburnea CBS 473.64]|uniref:Uncharacterized protein n=1 Tax=Massarina eburnea CBS 473.64 TaxID=1395130 RepID=A0A6A6S3V9_9PLEO|nr:hypothetical protein P280DRAFT_548449 [Massarina eburnea CBS 473.64]